MIEFKHKGSFKNTQKFLKNAQNVNLKKILEKYGEEGVQALASATPTKTGLTAKSWEYKIEINRGNISITWLNTNVVNGVPVAILLQYGHGTRGGGYVQGYDYINPAIQPIFDKIADTIWREVIKR